MDDLKRKKAAADAQIEEIPDEDAGLLELMKYNTKRLYKEYLGTRNKRKVALDFSCFILACFAIKNYGEVLSV